MQSKWFNSKPEAVRLRTQGKSLPYINTTLGIPKSTLSNWFKDIKLTEKQKETLNNNWKKALIDARSKATLWHNNEKRKRLLTAEQEGLSLLQKIDIHNIYTTELALALLYLGEGTKRQNETAMGSSDPVILKFFVACLRRIYMVPEEKIRCELHLRADQDPDTLRTYWAKELNISEDNFNKPYLDQRTKGVTSYDSYKGVCLVRCGRVAIQRKLVYIAKHFCTEISAGV
jgi:hypothetical protein